LAKSDCLRILLFLAVVVVLASVFVLIFGDRLLISPRPPIGTVNGVVVLQGSFEGERARIAGAVKLLQQGIAPRALLSVPHVSFWGESIPPIARAYLERTYGQDWGSHIDFCETDADTNSTDSEMQALTPCIRQHHWQSIVVVTSNYHTRRAAMIWNRLARQDPSMRVWVAGVDDPEFQKPWWRHRLSAKIFFLEFTKLVWTTFGG
jgi:uncharacterized SAM-binding protein YcdF (DUF218 family)